MNKTTVYIDDQEIILFAGARVIDAVRAYSEDLELKLDQGAVQLTDCDGNRIYMDGALRSGDRLLTRKGENDAEKS